jgi:hypothetical protein
VAQVAGVLLDQVQVDQAQRHGLAVVGELIVQGRVGHGRVDQLELLGQPGVVGGGPGRVGPLEVGALAAERVVDRLAREALAEPDAFHLGHVAHQPKQGQVRRRHGPLGQLLPGQAGALVQQRGPLPVQEGLQQRALGTGERPARPLHVGGLPRHGVHPATSPEPAQPIRVGQYVDGDDLAVRDPESEHRHQPALLPAEHARRPVDQRVPRGHPDRENSCSRPAAWAAPRTTGARPAGAEVGPQHDIRIQQFQ